MLHRMLTSLTHRITELPILVLMPHSRCNCRCVMCDIWKANQEKQELSCEDLSRHIDSLRKLKVKRVALSGGEALMHSNLWNFCELLKSIGVKISLLTTGLTLKHHVEEVLHHTDDVIVSIDGSPEVHNRIRNVPNAFEKLEMGIQELKRRNPDFKVTGRCVLQKSNYFDFLNTIEAAKSLGLDQISFLPADVSSQAFNRPNGWGKEKTSSIALTSTEAKNFEQLVIKSFEANSNDYQTQFIAENHDKITAIVKYYKALLGETNYPAKKCNAPWASVVVESDGEVKPCFFHPSYGNLHDNDLLDTINSPSAVTFRKYLDVKTDPTCVRCVCSLHVGIMQSNY